MERGWRDISPNCPRCGSSNTKFCYYNNYSLTQPRYFCKGCRRYWTKGGSLRNVPVGGGCRKSRRSRSSSLRLVSASSNHQNHHGATHRSSSTPIFSHVGTNNIHVLPLHSYASDGNLSNMVESSTQSTNSETPTIDLAVVYANFLNQKAGSDDQLRSSTPFCDGNTNESTIMPSEFISLPNVHFSSIPDATTIVPSTQMVNIMETNNLPFSQTLSSFLQLSNNQHDHNQYFDATNFDNSIHHQHHEDASIRHGLESELPPLPGESSSQNHQHMLWNSSNNNDDNLQESSKLPVELEQDAQFSNLFIGSWTMSPLDLPSFETSTSPSKP
ncbi:uncharacterized protein LOC141592432 [Silene latifolia]|uniref:uncharacterized protein LOC141592432 n=1 Tax=Silene latifolia TaxID=37657 RepID=UPI003D776384